MEQENNSRTAIEETDAYAQPHRAEITTKVGIVMMCPSVQHRRPMRCQFGLETEYAKTGSRFVQDGAGTEYAGSFSSDSVIRKIH